MAFKKYRTALILFLVYIIIFTILSIAYYDPENPGGDITTLIPIEGTSGQLAVIFLIIYPVMAIIGSILAGYILTPLFLLVHKNIIGRKLIYGIQEISEPKNFKRTFRAFFPSLMAINLALMFAFEEDVYKALVPEENWVGTVSYYTTYLNSAAALLMFTIAISIALFSSVWFLLDSGIVYSNKNKGESLGLPIENRSVGGWYLYFLKGYAGIGVIFAYYNFISIFFDELVASGGDVITSFILNLIILLPFPIFLTIAAIPAIIILDIIKTSRINYVRKWANRLGIKNFVEISFENVKK